MDDCVMSTVNADKIADQHKFNFHLNGTSELSLKIQ